MAEMARTRFTYQFQHTSILASENTLQSRQGRSKPPSLVATARPTQRYTLCEINIRSLKGSRAVKRALNRRSPGRPGVIRLTICHPQRRNGQHHYREISHISRHDRPTAHIHLQSSVCSFKHFAHTSCSSIVFS